MAYCLRPMRREDVAQVTHIDLACFPKMKPAADYYTELINPMAHYLVLYDGADLPQLGQIPVQPMIAGFTGLWLIAGEAHVINIAVREEYRREGLGEYLFIGLIRKAIDLKASMITLEVRPSNPAAVQLYDKYGLTERGRRRAYYTDNREDAIIMTLDEPTSPEYAAVFEEMRQQYQEKWRRMLEFEG